MTERICTEATIAEVKVLHDKLQSASGTLLPSVFNEYNERLQFLLQLLNYRGIDTSWI